ncbi:hypothetical protein AgCh_007233 [Apium graveolens]
MRKKEIPLLVPQKMAGCQWTPPSMPSQDFSDGSISDEESLIKITLTGEQYQPPSLKDEHTKVCFQQKVSTLLPNATFGQHVLKELFAEFNEEDNLKKNNLAHVAFNFSARLALQHSPSGLFFARLPFLICPSCISYLPI